MASGELTLDNIKGFNVTTISGVTKIIVKDGSGISVTLEFTSDASTDLANAIRRAVSLPGARVTATEMRNMRAKEDAS